MRKRLISAGIICAIFIPLLLIGGMPFRIAVGLIAILSYREFLDLKGAKNYPFSVVILGLVAVILLTFSNRDILYTSLGLDYRYIAITNIFLLSPVLFYYEKGSYTVTDALKLLAFISFLGITLNVASNILIYNKMIFWYLLIVSIATDTFAFLTGRAIGKHKFTKISPNKTVEGVLGGAVMGSILGTIFYATFIGIAPNIRVLFVSCLLSIACQCGDLFFSAMKRERGIKDFSHIIPGHGGVLDRIDGLLFVISTYILLNGLI